MTAALVCPQGHQWPPQVGLGTLARCPVCAARLVAPPGALDATLCNSIPPTRPTAPRPAVTRPMPSVQRPAAPRPTPPATPANLGDTTLANASRVQAPVNPGDETLDRPGSLGGNSGPATDVAPPGSGYEIIKLLGRGGMGVVYQARQVALNRVVALKMIIGSQHASAESRIRFQIEAESIAKMTHSSIVQVYEFGLRDTYPFLALEYIDGGTLQDKLAAGLPKPRDAAMMLRQLALAMHYAHQRGVVHRDLKPANILMKPDGTPTITDFGLAKQIDNRSEQTHSGSILGTPNYMAPEQAAGDSAAIGPGTDIYALGAIFYDMLTGKPPFQGDSVVNTLDQVRHKEPVPPRQIKTTIPADLETICLKCLNKDAGKRYTTAQDLADDLGRFLKGEPIRARPVSTTERFIKWTRRNPAEFGLIVALCLGLVGCFGWLVEQWNRAEAARQAEIERRKKESLQQADNFMTFIGQLRAMYSSEIIARVRPFGIDVTPDYKNKKAAIPIWATFVYELSDRLKNQGQGQHTRLYSEYPFPWRQEGHSLDAFEKHALEALRADPKTPIYQFENYQGKQSLRYATADIMFKACVDCHNTHPQSPKTGWKEGDVRGVLEIILPVE